MVDFHINVIVDPSRARRGTRAVQRDLAGLERQAEALRTSISRAFAFVGAGLGARELLQLADAYTTVQNRVRTVTSSEAELQAVTSEVFGIASRTRSAFDATAEVYARTALAARELGVSQRELLQFTESLNQAVILSGAGAQEARNALVQLSQGIASGALRGDELRSVLEQLPVVADVIAESLGVTRGQLREMGAEGKISAEVVLQAFREAREELEGRFAESVPTVAGALTSLRNEIVRVLGEFDQARGVTRSIAEGILLLSKNADVLVRSLAGVGAALTSVFVTSTIRSAIVALLNPVTALPLAFGAATAAVVGFGDQITLSSDSVTTLADVAAVAFDRLKDAGSQAFVELHAAASSLFGDDFELNLQSALEAMARGADAIVGLWRGAFRAVDAIWRELPNIILQAGDLAAQLLSKTLTNASVALFKTIGDIFFRILKNARDIISAFGGAVGAASVGNDAAVESFQESIETSAKLIAGSITGFSDELVSNVKKLEAADFIPERDLEDESRQIGENIANAFREGFDSATGAQDLLKGILDEADKRAADRIADTARRDAESRAAQQAALAGLETAGPARVVAAGPSPFEQVLKDLQKEASLIGLSNREREIAIELRRIEAALAKEGTKLLPGQREQVEEILRANQALADQAEIVEQILGPQRQLEIAQAALSAAYRDGRISLQQYEDALLGFQITALESSTSAAAGAERAFLRIQQAAADHASLVESTILTAYDAATDAIADFALSGFQDLQSLQEAASRIFAQIAADLAKLAIQQGLSELFPSSTTQQQGGGGDSTASTIGLITTLLSLFGGAADGTLNAQAGKPIVVGERGPELFRPRTSGSILPTEQLAAMMSGPSGGSAAAPIVNVPAPAVTLVLNQTPNESFVENRVERYFDSSRGQKKFVETAGKNKRQMKEVTS